MNPIFAVGAVSGLSYAVRREYDFVRSKALFLSATPAASNIASLLQKAEMMERIQQIQEIDLSTLWRGVRRRAPWILATSLLLGTGTYFWSSSQPEIYSASASLISSGNSGQTNDPLIGGAIVKAPPLPEGAIPQALQSPQVVQSLMKSIRESLTIPDAEKPQVLESLQSELQAQRLRTLQLTSRIEQFSGGSGIYTLTAKARSPEAAAEIANLSSRALLKWDQQRALQNIMRAESGYQAQLLQIEQQLNTQTDSIERQTLVARRANIMSSLANVVILRDSVTGVLSNLSDAVAPSQAESPKPARDAVLVGLLGILVTTALAALRSMTDRTVRREEDLLALNLQVLAVIPRIRQRDVVMKGIVHAGRQVGLYEAIGFLRVNLLNSLNQTRHPVIMVSSTAPGEGKSSVTATLADGFATSGQRVLIIDADLRRGTQEAVWSKFNQSGEWHQLVGTGGARTVCEALLQPQNVQVLHVNENIDMLPAGRPVQDSLSIFNQANMQEALDLWSQNYDVVLVDTAPLLALADGLVLGKCVDGVLLVTEYGHTNIQAVRSLLRRTQNNELKILGAVINKANTSEDETYNYSYDLGRGVQV